MEVEGPMRAQIKETIKGYLAQFDIYAKLITEIVKRCDMTLDEVHGVPLELQHLKEQRSIIARKIIEESFLQNDDLNENSQEKRKMERIFKKTRGLEVKLIDTDAKIKKFEEKQEVINDCTDTAPEMKETYSKDYRMIFKKLEDARKNFPDIYKEAEDEINIHFLTPFK
ncbi:MAG TPA: hypothetical protein VKM55_27135 [Candidatus Lokiarchaeia archaeon]|nr:hypothetical protein [Candidatus Lokiarchaeia archaeon]